MDAEKEADRDGSMVKKRDKSN